MGIGHDAGQKHSRYCGADDDTRHRHYVRVFPLKIMATIQPLSEATYGIWHNSSWISGADGFTPIQHQNQDVLRPLLDFVNSCVESGQNRDFEISSDSPVATLFHMLSWRTVVWHGWSFVEAKSNWVFSCDPVFHLDENPDVRDLQIDAYMPVYEWLVEIGAEIREMPPLCPDSEDEWDALEVDPGYRLSESTTNLLLSHWMALTVEQKAAAHYIYEHMENVVPSLCAIMLFMTGRLKGPKLAEILLAASGRFPGTEEEPDPEYDTDRAVVSRGVLSARRTCAEI